MRVFVSRSCAIAVLIALAAASQGVAAYQQFGNITINLFSAKYGGGDPSYCSEAACWSSSSCTPPFTEPLWHFDDVLPAAAKLRSVHIVWNTGNDTRYMWESIPVVSLDLNGTPVGTQQVIGNGAECTPAAALPYTFTSADYPAGLPGYVRLSPTSNGVNTVNLTIANQDAPVLGGDNATITLNYELPPPFEFNVTEQATPADRRVLLSNMEAGYPYPQFQALGGQDSKVPMWVRARGTNGQYQSGITVYLRVLDPPDGAAYANPPYSTLAHVNDNKGPAATIEGTNITATAGYSGVWQEVSGANGEADFTLALSPLAKAGDNYQIEASLDPTFPANGTVKSGTLTAWKRVFVEKRKMLRNGILLSAASSAGASTIRIADDRYGGNQRNRRVSAGDTIVIVHAPKLDRSDALLGWYLEYHRVAGVQQVNGTNEFEITLGTRQGKSIMAESLQHPFGPDNAGTQVGDGIAYLSAASLAAGDYFDAPDTLLVQCDSVGNPTGSFSQAFTEYYVIPDTSLINGLVPIPHILASDEALLQRIADRWCQSVSAYGLVRPNHQLLVIGDTNGSANTPEAGHTTSNIPGEIASFTFRGLIDAEVQSGQSVHHKQNADHWAAKDEAHELAHQWSVNDTWGGTIGVTPGHCPADTTTFDDPRVYCLEATASETGSAMQSDNMIARFHLRVDPFNNLQSEYFEIREYVDPFLP